MIMPGKSYLKPCCKVIHANYLFTNSYICIAKILFSKATSYDICYFLTFQRCFTQFLNTFSGFDLMVLTIAGSP